MNFLVNASPPKAFDVVTSNSVGAKVTGCGGHWERFRILYNVFFCKCIFSLTVGCSNIKLCWCTNVT